MMWRPVLSFLLVAGVVAWGVYAVAFWKPWSQSQESKFNKFKRKKRTWPTSSIPMILRQCEQVKDLMIGGTPYYTVCLNNMMQIWPNSRPTSLILQ
jgi:hypothetical protein